MRETADQESIVDRSSDHVPLLVAPNRLIPPVAALEPRPIHCFRDVAARAEVDLARLTVTYLDARSLRWTKQAKTEERCRCGRGRFCGRDRERLDMEIAYPPGVVEDSHSDVAFAHDRRDLRQRYIEPS